jgi:general stress protein 26
LKYLANAPQTMNTQQLKFLQYKIADIRSALFSNESEAVLKLPTNIVSALTVDDVGQIWFFVNRPQQMLQEFDREFPAKLRFFKKGKEYFLHISGKAFIINDPEEIQHLVSLPDDVREAAINNRFVLLKMRIQKAEYFERHSRNSAAGFTSLISKMFSWLFDHKTGTRQAPVLQGSAAA